MLAVRRDPFAAVLADPGGTGASCAARKRPGATRDAEAGGRGRPGLPPELSLARRGDPGQPGNRLGHGPQAAGLASPRPGLGRPGLAPPGGDHGPLQPARDASAELVAALWPVRRKGASDSDPIAFELVKEAAPSERQGFQPALRCDRRADQVPRLAPVPGHRAGRPATHAFRDGMPAWSR